MHFNASININSSAETAWGILMDFNSYKEWNPFVVHAASDDRRIVNLHLDTSPNERYVALDLKIEQAHAPHHLRGKLLYGPPGLGGHYTLRIDEHADHITITQAVTLTGLLRPLYVSKYFVAQAQRGLEAMNAALVWRCRQA